MSLDITMGPPPRYRAFAACVALCAIIGAKHTPALLFFVGACAIILTALHQFGHYARFLIRFWFPLAAGLLVVWGVIVRGTPEVGRAAGMRAGLEFAGFVALRLAALAALFQVTFLSLRGLRLATFLNQLGLPPFGTAVAVSVFNLWPDFARRTEQVVAARCARGLMPDRRFVSRAQQLPWTLRTLFVGSLGGSLDRADRWQAERLPERMMDAATSLNAGSEGNRILGILWCLAAAMWALWALWK